MAQAPLITISDFAGRIDISGNLDASKKLAQHILHAQDFDLRALMGDEFYYDFLANVTEDKYARLLNGDIYELQGNVIDFDGIKVVMVYFAAARLIPNLDSHITAHGVMTKKNEFSDHSDAKEKARMASEYLNLAKAYWNKIEKFLINNPTGYELWRGYKNGDVKGGKRKKVYGVHQSDNDNDYYERRGRFTYGR